MNIQCPRCKAQNTFNPDKLTQSGERIVCSDCNSPFLIKQKSSAKQTEEARDRVMVANPNPHFCSAIKDFLSGRNFDVIIAKDGGDAMQFLEIKIPDVALVDVALPGMYGFELCDFIKNSEKLKDIKVILLASIYDKTRYKRMPNSIYGADDYIEIHHIPDQLVQKINNLLGKDINSGGSPVKVQAREFEVVIMDEERLSEKVKDMAAQDIKVEMAAGGGKGNAQEEAMRLARIIISDIILYNQETVEKGIKEGNLLELLKDDIKEGVAYYVKRAPAEVRKNTTFLKNAFEELIAKIKKEMGV
jgi:predicted Zn finger-like uncharacterized protein